MMLQYLLHRNKYCGVEHFTDVAGNNIYYFLELKKKKGDLFLVSSQKFYSIHELAKHLKKKDVLVVINTDKVLTKIKSATKSLMNRKIWEICFPNLQEDEFFIESYQGQKYFFCSICRKDYINNLLNEYKKEGIKVIDFSIGSWCLHSIFPFMNKLDFCVHAYRIRVQEGEVYKISEIDFILRKYVVNGIKVSNDYFISLAAIISHYSRIRVWGGIDLWKAEGVLGDFIQKRLFNIGIRVVITSTVLLLGWYLFLTYYYNREIEITKQKITQYEITPESLKQIKKELFNKQELQERLQNNFSNKAWVLNELAQTLPSSTGFTNIELCPLLMKPEENEIIRTDERTVIISGTTVDLKKLSNWVLQLEGEDWIRFVQIQDIGKDDYNKLDFKLLIQISDEL